MSTVPAVAVAVAALHDVAVRLQLRELSPAELQNSDPRLSLHRGPLLAVAAVAALESSALQPGTEVKKRLAEKQLEKV